MTNDNNDYLSQEEIDALLNRSASASDEEPTVADEEFHVDQFLTPMEQDAIGEIGNISFGSAATALSTLLGQKVEITTPKVSVVKREKLHEKFPQPHVAVHVRYIEGFQGINLLVIKTRDAEVIADLMLGGDGTNVSGELNEIHISAVQEAMNQMMGSAATSMSTIFNRLVNISPPGIDIMDLANEEGTSNIPEEDVLVNISFRLRIGELIDSSIMQLVTVNFAKEMIASLMGESAEETDVHKSSEQEVAAAVETPVDPAELFSEEEIKAVAEQVQEMVAADATTNAFQQDGMEQPPASYAANQPPAGQQPMGQPQYGQAMGPGPAGPMGTTGQPHYGQPMGQPPMEQPYYGQPQQPYAQYPGQQSNVPPPPTAYGQGALQQGRNINVQPVEYTQFSDSEPLSNSEVNLNLLMDIPLKVTVELGRTRKLIREILEFTQGSIIELDKLAGEPVDILVNDKLIAKGEVVVIDENFGVRVIDIVSQLDRLQKIQ